MNKTAGAHFGNRRDYKRLFGSRFHSALVKNAYISAIFAHQNISSYLSVPGEKAKFAYYLYFSIKKQY